MRYVDGFLIPVPKKNVAAYLRMARKAGKVWLEYGALQFCESSGDDLVHTMSAAFPKTLKLKPGETAFFSWIVFKSKADRDRINKKVTVDPRLADMMDMKNMPFDAKRMVYGGFRMRVDME
jgi:uncharacterized protein YbaA (DUF1428 family)